MTEPYESVSSVNGNTNGADADADAGIHNPKRHRFNDYEGGEETEDLCGLVKGLVSSVFFPDPTSDELVGTTLLKRARVSIGRDLPRVRDASRVSGLRIVRWTKQGSALRGLLVVSVGTITLLSLTGLLVFLLFFAAATVNAVVISALMSLAAVGGFLAIFFASLVAIYIGALSVAIFVISTATISAVIAVLIATGWIGFFWVVWLAARKSAGLARKSINMTGSTLTAYSSVWHSNRHRHHHHE